MNNHPEEISLPELHEANFETRVLHCAQPVLVSFQAPGSRYCEIFNLTLAEVALACADKIKVFKVNTDNNRTLGARLEVEFIPTLLCFVNGSVRIRIVGMSSTTAILDELGAVLQNDCPPPAAMTPAASHPHGSNTL